MAEVVDSIIAELIARDNGYIETFDRATAAHGRFKASVGQLKAQTFDLGAEGQKYKQGVAAMGAAEEKTTATIKRTRKARADAAIADDARVVASAKKTADAQIAEAQRSVRLRAMVERSLAEQAALGQKGSGSMFGSAVPREASMIPPSTIPAVAAGAATGEVAEQAAGEAEINHLLADQATLQASLTVARGRDRDIIRDQITEMRLFNSLVRAGYTEEQATEQVQKRMLAIETERVAIAKRQAGQEAGRFAAGVGLGRFGGINAATAGIATAAVVAGGIAAVGASVDYAKQLASTAQALGLTTTQLQVYQRAARDVNVSNEQLQSGFGQMAAYLGKAQEGDKQAAKTFEALGINIKGVANAGDLLPTLIQRISQIPNAAQRAAVETRIFGEEGRRLDPLLSGGIDKVNSLATAMQAAGRVLSPQDIKTLQDAGKVLADVKQQIEVDIAKVVAGNASAIKGLANAFSDLITQLRGVSRIVHDEGWLSEIFNNNNANVRAAGAGGVEDLRVNRIPKLQAAKKTFDDAVEFDKLSTGDKLARTLNPLNPPPKLALQAATDNYKNEIALTRASLADIKASRQTQPVQPGKPGDLSHLFQTGGKSADQLAAEADERTRRFQAAMGRLQDERLSAESQVTSDEQARSAIVVEQLNIDRKAQLAEAVAQADADIRRGADKKLTLSRLALQKQAINAVADGRIEVQTHRDTLSDIQRIAAIRSQQLDQADEALKTEEDQATTSAERARIEKQLLANDIERQRVANQTVLDRAKAGDGSITQQDIATAKGNLGDLGRKQALGNASIEARNLGPLAEFFKNLPKDAAQSKEALERVAADGLGSISDGLANVISGARSLKDVFHGVAQQIIADLARIAIEKAIAFGVEALTGGGSLLSNSQASSWAAGNSSFLNKLPARAAGGPVVGGQPYLVGEHRPEVFIPNVSGAIAPDVRSSGGGNGGGSGTVEHRIVIEPNEMFDTHVDTRVVGGIVQYAPVIIEGAKSATFAAASRPGLPRSAG